MSGASSDEKSENSMGNEHDQVNGQENNQTKERDIWSEVYEAVYDPSPEVNRVSLDRFLKTVKNIRSRSSLSLLVDTAVRFTNCFIWFTIFLLYIFHSACFTVSHT